MLQNRRICWERKWNKAEYIFTLYLLFPSSQEVHHRKKKKKVQRGTKKMIRDMEHLLHEEIKQVFPKNGRALDMM